MNKEKRYYYPLDYAKQFGDREAIFIQNLRYWIIYNKTKNSNFKNNRTWMYNTRAKLLNIFPFWTPKKLWLVIDSLKKQGVIITDNFNHNKYDRTLWYAFKNEDLFLKLEDKMDKEKGKMDFPSREKGLSEKGKSKTITKPITKNYNPKKDYIRVPKDGTPLTSSNKLFNIGDIGELSYKINPGILAVLQALKDNCPYQEGIGGFTTILPKDGQEPSNIVKDCISFLKEIKEGSFFRTGLYSRQFKLKLDWQKEYIKTYPKGYETWDEVRDLVLKALELYKEDYRSRNNLLYKQLNQFFFNQVFPAKDGISPVLKFWEGNMIPKSEVKTAIDIQKENLGEDIIEVFHSADSEWSIDLSFFKKERDLIFFYSNMTGLKKWFKNNIDRIVRYNDIINNNTGTFGLSNPVVFFKIVARYLNKSRYFSSHPCPFEDQKSENWIKFADFVKEETDGFEITIDPKMEMELPKMEMERKINQIRDSYERKVENRFKVLKQACDNDPDLNYSDNDLSSIVRKEIGKEMQEDIRLLKSMEQQLGIKHVDFVTIVEEKVDWEKAFMDEINSAKIN